MTPESANEIYAELNSRKLTTQEVLIVSENSDILAESAKAGMITIAYLPPAETTDAAQEMKDAEMIEVCETENIPLPQVDIIVEGFEEVDYDFFEKIYQRHHGLPWTILETERLVVRELALSDMDALFELYSYEGMTDYMEGLYPYEEEYEYQKAYIANMYRFFGYGMWLVFEKETGKLVGRAGVEHREELEEHERKSAENIKIKKANQMDEKEIEQFNRIQLSLYYLPGFHYMDMMNIL